jgi:hypothetical protein
LKKTSRPDITIDRQTGRTFTADRQTGYVDREADSTNRMKVRTNRKSVMRTCMYTGRHNIQIDRKTELISR